MSNIAIELCERGWLPDVLTRFGMRRLMAQRISDESADHGELEFERFRGQLAELQRSEIAVATDAANEQHYEVPPAFFEQVLGPHLKYSCCLWPDIKPGNANLADSLGTAEAAMLELSCARAEIADGQRILELGCGWGSLTVWMAQHFPSSQITAVSNSASQRSYIESRCAKLGLTNVTVLTADANEFSTSDRFDRVISIEMFEHMRNYARLLERIAGWLNPGGKLFVHIFCHRDLLYPFNTDGESDWMGKYFFTGGLMPSEHTLLYFPRHLQIEEQWRVSGVHYQKTSEAWLQLMDRHRAQIMPVMIEAYGAEQASRWFQRWRMFFMAVAELFGYRNGTDWMVGHYRFVKAQD